MEVIKTKKTLEREKRNANIIEMFLEIETPQSQVTAVCELISEKLNIKFGTVYRVISKFRKS